MSGDSRTMKAISLWQPWASAVALGWKHHETRHWATKYRGLIAIHAAKRWTREERLFLARMEDQNEIEFPLPMPLGQVVAVAELEECIELVGDKRHDVVSNLTLLDHRFGNFDHGRFAWKLENVIALPVPIDCKGRQALFDLPDDVELRVRAQIPERLELGG